MAKIVSSYCTKVIGENRIFKDTIRFITMRFLFLSAS